VKQPSKTRDTSKGLQQVRAINRNAVLTTKRLHSSNTADSDKVGKAVIKRRNPLQELQQMTAINYDAAQNAASSTAVTANNN
jgi:hypothetical protein